MFPHEAGLLNCPAHGLPRIARRVRLDHLIVPLLAMEAVYLTAMESAGACLAWLAALGLLMGAAWAVGSWLGRRAPVLFHAGVAFAVLSTIGLVLVACYRSLYGLDFAPYGDDSYYFLQIHALARGEPVEAFTLYERAMAWWLPVLRLTDDRLGVLHLLPTNWAIGALAAALALELAEAVRPGHGGGILCLLAVLGHCVFTESVCNLYRDGLMLVLLLLALLAAWRRQWVLAVGASVLAGLVRGANGLLALLGVALLAVATSRRAQARPRIAIALCVAALASVLAMDQVLHLGRYLRSLDPSRAASGDTLLSSAAVREETFLAGAPATDDAAAVAYRMGPAGAALRPALVVFAPFRLPSPRADLDVRVQEYPWFRATGFLPESPWMWATALLWIVVGPPLLIGLARAWRGPLACRMLLLIWALAVLGVTFVSFQHRHRAAFIVLAPVFVALAAGEVTPRQRQVRWALAGLFALGLVVRNVVLAG